MSTITQVALCPICGTQFLKLKRQIDEETQIPNAYYFQCTGCYAVTPSVATLAEVGNLVTWVNHNDKSLLSKG